MLRYADAEGADNLDLPDDLIGRAEKVLAATRLLCASLHETQSAGAALAVHNVLLIAEFRSRLEALTTTARDLLGQAVETTAPELISKPEETVRRYLNDNRDDLAKESLARMAAQLAGREPDERVRVKLGDFVAFDGQVWCYQDFVDRAERAFAELAP